MPFNPERIRQLLLELGAHVRDRLIAARQMASGQPTSLSAVSRESAADTIYEIDRVSEEAIESWFFQHWPAELPVELVMEGIEPDHPITIPHGTPVDRTVCKCILDPIDGTRGIMYDKRSAWFLGGVASQKGPETGLTDISVAAMVELPTTRQWRSDSVSAVRNQGVVCDSMNLFTGEVKPLKLRPSRATDVLHGFAYISRFFPVGKALTATVEERLWASLGLTSVGKESVIFEDQYICTGGQFYEILSGHDRMIADIRPLVFEALGIESALCCHPYDVSSSLVLTELGIPVEKPFGGPLDAPLDTTSPVAWVAFANHDLADRIRPAFQKVLEEVLNP
jgi:hypothetical protein